eukprot:TRINITY_DN100989_c0_g1_i1.p1 TRINITY_DN100989_c0_g1~~TRINITY_DN100989_c0_g1_i1.p1  ORF type:complete len:1146 (+),score=382.27 TRINITY_DN100989_c0_g1_i1:121-3558(+)
MAEATASASPPEAPPAEQAAADGEQSATPKKEIPYCTTCIVVVLMILHFLTMWGHLTAASGISTIGRGLAGWSTVGESISMSLVDELDEKLEKIQHNITNASAQMLEIGVMLDTQLSGMAEELEGQLEKFKGLAGSNPGGGGGLPAGIPGIPDAPGAEQPARQRPALLGESTSEASGAPAEAPKEAPAAVPADAAKVASAADAAAGAQAAGNGNATATEAQAPMAIQSPAAASLLQEADAQRLEATADSLYEHMMRQQLDGMGEFTSMVDLGAGGLVGIDPGMNVPIDKDKPAGEQVKTMFMTAIKQVLMQSFIKKFLSMVSAADFKKILYPMIRKIVNAFVEPVAKKVQQMYTTLKPTLLSISEVIDKFGVKQMQMLKDASSQVEKAQKVYDTVASGIVKAASVPEDKYELGNATFKIFDNDRSGTLTMKEVTSTAKVFELPTLSGSKGKELFQKYAQKGGVMAESDYLKFLDDQEAATDVAIMVTYLGAIEDDVLGRLQQASLEGEVTFALAEELCIDVIRQSSEVEKTAAAVVSSMMPENFTAGVLASLTQVNQTKLGRVGSDCEQVVLQQMIQAGKPAVQAGIKRLSSPVWWDSRGYDPEKQASALKTINKWLSTPPPALLAERGMSLPVSSLLEQRGGLMDALTGVDARHYIPTHAAASLLEGGLASGTAAYMAASEAAIEHKVNAFAKAKRAESRQKNFAGKIGQCLKLQLLGGEPATKGAAHMDTQAAADVVLTLAKKKVETTRKHAGALFQECTRYVGRPCDPRVDIGGLLKKGVKNIEQVVEIMNKYASKKGIEKIEGDVKKFNEKGADDVTLVLMSPIDFILPDDPLNPPKEECTISSNRTLPDVTASTDVLLQVARMLEEEDTGASNAFGLISDTIRKMNAELPKTKEYCESARTNIRELAMSIYDNMRFSGEGFHSTAKMLKIAFIVYFIFIGSLTLVNLYYAWWSSGWFGGPKSYDLDDGEYQAPTGFQERCGCCWRWCCSWCTWCQDSAAGFWILITMMKLFVIILMLLSLVMIILGGVWIGVSVALNSVPDNVQDEELCGDAMMSVKEVLKTFWSNTQGEGADPKRACVTHDLLFMKTAASNFYNGGLFIIIGAVPVPFFTFYLVFFIATMHERARWRRKFDAATKNLSS